jgi:molybdate transport system regulatory protein
MSIVWAICRAAKGGGKTSLAQALAHVLPHSTYAKCEHGKPATDKPLEFFSDPKEVLTFIDKSRASCEHIIIESNSPDCLDQANIVIFIDAGEKEANVRSDADRLRSRADIVILPDSRLPDCTEKLRKVICADSLLQSISRVLSKQQLDFHDIRPQVRLKIWLEREDRPILGKGLVHLLQNVQNLGTLQAAAKVSAISYRHAWNMIHNAEENLGRKLIHRRTGGRSGGKSVLTDTGRTLIEIFAQLDHDVHSYAEKRLAELYPDAPKPTY